MMHLRSVLPLAVVVMLVLGLTTSCALFETSTNDTNLAVQATNIAVIERNYDEVWNQGDLAVIDEIYSGNYVGHDSHSAADRRGLDGVRQHVTMYRTAFPNVLFSVEDIFAAEDRVAVRWTASGKHMGPMMEMEPTEKEATIMGISIFRLVNGKIEETWFGWDTMDMMQQLGAVVQMGNGPSGSIDR